MSNGHAAARLTVDAVVNGTTMSVEVPARRLLSDFLRSDLALTGTKVGCESGVCGACTVLLDGEPVRSCLLLAAQIDHHQVDTVESLADGDGLDALQSAFRESHALQCGFCTPGILMTLAAADPDDYPTDSDIRILLSGNTCRCTGYHNIVAGVRRHWGRTSD